MFYILATLDSGEVVICEFQKAQAMRKFARDVMSGSKALPVWRVLSTTHPASGEEMPVRSRRFINGSTVAGMEAVQPREGFEESHGYAPDNFEPMPEFKAAGYGFWTCTEGDAPEGAVIGMKYPVKRDALDQRRYVTLRVAEGDAPERRHYLDAERGGVSDHNDYDDEDVSFDDDTDWADEF